MQVFNGIMISFYTFYIVGKKVITPTILQKNVY